MKSVPDWISAGVAVVALGGGLSGMYSTMKTEDAVILYKVSQLSERVTRAEEYDGVLTDDMNKFELELNTQKSTIEYLAIGQSKLDGSILKLTEAVNKMNETLVAQGVRNGGD